MKYISMILLAWIGIYQAGQDSYVCKNAKVSLYSNAPIEDIKASTSPDASVFNSSSGELEFSVAITSYEFEKQPSDYMEVANFPGPLLVRQLI